MPINYVYGSEGDDTLYGTYSNDVIYGLGGDDVLVTGNSYVDRLNGGAGADTFDFNSTSGGAHTIEDYHWWEGDKIDVSTIDAKEYSWYNPSTWGNQAFTWKGDVTNNGPHGGLGRGELGYRRLGSDTFVELNTDGDSQSEFQIQVKGYVPFIASDFVL
jgi:Ca2+-binding RTX toxin-like protein